MGYRIYSGMGGGFGGAEFTTWLDTDDKEEAESLARELAIEEYQSYEGYHGILSYMECAQELYGEGPTGEVPEWVWASVNARDEIEAMYTEEVESWIEYWVEEGDDEEEE